MPPQQGLLAGFATGLLCLKVHVENMLGTPVEIIDLSAVNEGEVARHLKCAIDDSLGPALFGITTTTASYRITLEVARRLKCLKGHDAIIILGGHHASADAATILHNHPKLVDFVVCGEGETPLVELIKRWPHVDDVPALWSLDPNGDLICNPPAPPLAPDILDTLVIDPEWFREGHEPGKFDRYTYVSARGCPLRCRFCSVANSAIRGKSPEVVAREVTQIVQAGYRRLAIEDNFFAHSPKRTREICTALKALRDAGVHFTWDCQTRVEAVARAGVPRLLKEAGCDEVYLGVEALSGDALNFLGKALNPGRYFAQLEEVAVPELLGHGLGVNINLQCGLPEEAQLDVAASLQRLGSLGVLAAAAGTRLQVFPQLFVVYPGTAHFSEFCELGVLWPEIFETFVDWECQNPEFVDWLGYNFAHGAGGVPLGILDRESLVQRRFVIDWSLARAAERFRQSMASLMGVSVFEYQSHLVRRNLPVALAG